MYVYIVMDALLQGKEFMSIFAKMKTYQPAKFSRQQLLPQAQSLIVVRTTEHIVLLQANTPFLQYVQYNSKMALFLSLDVHPHQIFLLEMN